MKVEETLIVTYKPLKIFQKNNYQTAIVGKWHLGTEPKGFDYGKSFG